MRDNRMTCFNLYMPEFLLCTMNLVVFSSKYYDKYRMNKYTIVRGCTIFNVIVTFDFRLF